MRIIAWNCQGAFRRKNKEIFDLKPDLLIVSECEQEHILEFGRLTPQPKDFLWYGDTNKKGIGIFSFSDYRFRLLKEFNPQFRYIVPIEVTDDKNAFLLFAIWAMDNKVNPVGAYIGQVWYAVNYYQTLLHENAILIGDFNSNKIWDEKARAGNHSDVVNFLKKHGIESLYHKQFNEEHGKETVHTFCFQKNRQRPYHIDYIFASDNIVKNGYKLRLESADKWIDKSDHVPMILDVNPFKSKVSFKNTYYDFAGRHLRHLAKDTRNKFREELSGIDRLAIELDSQPDKEKLGKLISRIEVLKQIDRLITAFP